VSTGEKSGLAGEERSCAPARGLLLELDHAGRPE